MTQGRDIPAPDRPSVAAGGGGNRRSDRQPQARCDRSHGYRRLHASGGRRRRGRSDAHSAACAWNSSSRSWRGEPPQFIAADVRQHPRRGGIRHRDATAPTRRAGGAAGRDIGSRIGIEISDTIADQSDITSGSGVNVAGAVAVRVPDLAGCAFRAPIHDHVEEQVACASMRLASS